MTGGSRSRPRELSEYDNRTKLKLKKILYEEVVIEVIKCFKESLMLLELKVANVTHPAEQLWLSRADCETLNGPVFQIHQLKSNRNFPRYDPK